MEPSCVSITLAAKEALDAKVKEESGMNTKDSLSIFSTPSSMQDEAELAKRELVEANLRFVVSIKKYTNRTQFLTLSKKVISDL